MNDQDVKRCLACGKVWGFCDCRMPQTDMSAKELVDTFGITSTSVERRAIEAIAQRDRDTLEAAAERVCEWCDCHCAEEEKDTCELRGKVLAPLAEGWKHGG